jgi:hypothetical protein
MKRWTVQIIPEILQEIDNSFLFIIAHPQDDTYRDPVDQCGAYRVRVGAIHQPEEMYACKCKVGIRCWACVHTFTSLNYAGSAGNQSFAFVSERKYGRQSPSFHPLELLNHFPAAMNSTPKRRTIGYGYGKSDQTLYARVVRRIDVKLETRSIGDWRAMPFHENVVQHCSFRSHGQAVRCEIFCTNIRSNWTIINIILVSI